MFCCAHRQLHALASNKKVWTEGSDHRPNSGLEAHEARLHAPHPLQGPRVHLGGEGVQGRQRGRLQLLGLQRQVLAHLRRRGPPCITTAAAATSMKTARPRQWYSLLPVALWGKGKDRCEVHREAMSATWSFPPDTRKPHPSLTALLVYFNPLLQPEGSSDQGERPVMLLRAGERAGICSRMHAREDGTSGGS